MASSGTEEIERVLGSIMLRSKTFIETYQEDFSLFPNDLDQVLDGNPFNERCPLSLSGGRYTLYMVNLTGILYHRAIGLNYLNGIIPDRFP